MLPDSTWEYHLDCRQVGSSSFLKQLFDGERNNAKVTLTCRPRCRSTSC
ncbi:MAG: hypothetical protein IPI48_18680 [bacterium]|nr:hypothetical protein [bacterium]